MLKIKPTLHYNQLYCGDLTEKIDVELKSNEEIKLFLDTWRNFNNIFNELTTVYKNGESVDEKLKTLDNNCGFKIDSRYLSYSVSFKFNDKQISPGLRIGFNKIYKISLEFDNEFLYDEYIDIMEY